MGANLADHRDATEGGGEHRDVPAASVRGAWYHVAIDSGVPSRLCDRQAGTVRRVRGPRARKLFKRHAERLPGRFHPEVQHAQVEVKRTDDALLLVGIDAS